MRLEGIRDGEGGWFVRLAFWLLRRQQGAVPPPMRIYAYRPAIMRAFGRLARTVRQSGALPPRLKGLAMHWTSRVAECSY